MLLSQGAMFTTSVKLEHIRQFHEDAFLVALNAAVGLAEADDAPEPLELSGEFIDAYVKAQPSASTALYLGVLSFGELTAALATRMGGSVGAAEENPVCVAVVASEQTAGALRPPAPPAHTPPTTGGPTRTAPARCSQVALRTTSPSASSARSSTRAPCTRAR
jgi:hypothetical protein